MRYTTILLGVFLTMSVANASEFEVGQKWEYKTRPVENGSFLTIVKIDTIKGTKINHISLEGVKIKNPQAPNGFGNSVSHMPITEEALRGSVTKMIGLTKALPDYKEGYDMWRKAFDQGKGGYFTIPVSECVEYMEKAINQ